MSEKYFLNQPNTSLPYEPLLVEDFIPLYMAVAGEVEAQRMMHGSPAPGLAARFTELDQRLQEADPDHAELLIVGFKTQGFEGARRATSLIGDYLVRGTFDIERAAHYLGPLSRNGDLALDVQTVVRRYIGTMQQQRGTDLGFAFARRELTRLDLASQIILE